MDYGETGLLDTMKILRKRGIAFAGAGRNIVEASEPVIISSNGYKLAFVCAADPRFQCAGKSNPGVLPAEPEILREIIGFARCKVDHVIVSIHAGMEFTRVPTPFMQRISEQCIESGASIVQFHHAHCLSGVTQRKKSLIVWGSGNYLFPYCLPFSFHPWFDSAIWNVSIGTQEENLKVDFIPVSLNYFGYPSPSDVRKGHRIRKSVDSCTRKIKEGRLYVLWRAYSIFHPRYLRLACWNYFYMMRRTGICSVLSYIRETLRVYFRRDEHTS